MSALFSHSVEFVPQVVGQIQLRKEKRPFRGVGPEMLSLAGLDPTPQIETLLTERRASDAIAGGVSGLSFLVFGLPVKYNSRLP